jgi:hypothetical protein
MLASRYFKIQKTAADDWFDPILNADTKLFVDPFLVFKDKSKFWRDAYSKVIAHFDHAFLLIAQSSANPQALAYKKALDLLTFAEPREFCLGYTAKGTQGAGSGAGYARLIAAAIVDAIKRGLTHPKHFEELGILNEGIGADRISDITCTILKPDLIAYSNSIAARHKLSLGRHRLFAAAFDVQRLRWQHGEVEVPTNPLTDNALLFVPAHFLRELPTLNADDWWESWVNEHLRQDVNYEIMGRVDKATIVKTAREHPEQVRAWTEQKEGEEADSYDLKADPKGVWAWDTATFQFTSVNPVSLPAATDHEGFLAVIEHLILQYKLFIEEQGGWSLLWNERGADKPEDAAQLLFRGIAQNYCHANNIVIDREVELGRGPVDFKFSSGYAHRAHLEVKKEHNGKFWNGLEEQLPSYMKSDQVTDGWFLAIRYRDNDAAKARLQALPKRVDLLAKATGLNVRFGIVDARRPLSASKLKRRNQ